MKNRTKTGLIFALILAAVFLIGLLDGGAASSAAAESEEEGMLIGVFVSEEDIDTGDDLKVTSPGKFSWTKGRLYAERTEEGWRFPDLPDGGGIFSVLPMESDNTDPEAERRLLTGCFPEIVYIGNLGKADGRSNVNRESGTDQLDIDLSGEVYACGDRQVIFNLYPIYQTSDGRIYLTRGNSMGMSGADGASVTHTLTRDKTETIGGKSERVKVRVAITAVSRPTPTKFTVAHMDENDDLLKLEEFAPDALPESITAAPGAAYLIGTSYGQDWDGETAEYTISSRSNDSAPYAYSKLNTFRYQDGKLCSISIPVKWGEGAA